MFTFGFKNFGKIESELIDSAFESIIIVNEIVAKLLFGYIIEVETEFQASCHTILILNFTRFFYTK